MDKLSVTPRRRIARFFEGKEQLFEQVCLYLLFGGLGALLGSAELLFGVRPFGLALCAAAGTMLPAVATGVAFFSLIVGDYISIAALGVLLLCRLIFSGIPGADKRRPPLLCERVGFRVLSGAIAVLGVALYVLIRNGFRYYHLLGLLLGSATAALATFLLAGLFLQRDRLYPRSREGGLAALLLMSIFAVRDVCFIGIYPAAVMAALLAFSLGAQYGLSLGVLGGALCGLCFDIRTAPAFLLCGLGFALLEKSSRGGAVLTGGGLGAVYAYAVLGSQGLGMLLPSLLTAGAIFLAVDSAGLIAGAPAHRLGAQRRRGAAIAARGLWADWNAERMKSISEAFLDLSGILYELGSRQRRPGLLDLKHLCDREFDRVCPRCEHREICWGSQYNATVKALEHLGQRLYHTGGVERTHVPSDLAERCPHLPAILEGINNATQRLCEETLRGDKTSVVAMDYASLGRVIGETLETGREAHETDGAAAERITAALMRRGYTLESVSVCGRTHRRVLLQGVRLPGRRIKIRELRTVLEQQCRFLLGEAECFEHEGVQDILFGERVVLQCRTVKQTRAKSRTKGGYCGDSVMSFSSTRGYDYAFVCDGMGSGNTAALTSALAATVLSRLLRAGNRADTSLRMLNGLLAARSRRECEASTTVDLLEVDCVNGEASLFKCGAAPTYLLRQGRATRFFSRTAPVGILESLDAERIRFELEVGDVLVQMSDGVSGGEEECLWLCELLCERWDGDAQKFARLVLARASEESQDDLSVLVTEVLPADTLQ